MSRNLLLAIIACWFPDSPRLRREKFKTRLYKILKASLPLIREEISISPILGGSSVRVGDAHATHIAKVPITWGAQIKQPFNKSAKSICMISAFLNTNSAAIKLICRVSFFPHPISHTNHDRNQFSSTP